MIRMALLVALVACGEKKADAPASVGPAGSAAPAVPVAATAAKPAEPPAEVHDANCEALRDKYLAWSADRVKGALGGNVAGAQTAELQAEADKEMAIAKTKFVGACVAMGSALDGSCFEIEHGMSRDRNKHERCMKIVHELEAKMFAK